MKTFIQDKVFSIINKGHYYLVFAIHFTVDICSTESCKCTLLIAIEIPKPTHATTVLRQPSKVHHLISSVLLYPILTEIVLEAHKSLLAQMTHGLPRAVLSLHVRSVQLVVKIGRAHV